MHDIIIQVSNVAKQYRLGQVGTGTLNHDINRWWHRILGKEDPYLKIGEENDRAAKGSSQYVWALRDINFEVNRGEALGIIGRNGAGKSTLLKILSRTTTPTKGEIKLKGRVASLLEVGTGFHPDLSGRDNIFLNGAILGMTRNEIKKKFDEIVDFAGVARYIDTPVKRYSSGMYVRLAFAVAAHLEPEILIVDEVLAVGDAEFQKKCLGKMNDVSKKEGRTVLFVSHNMGSIKQLCTHLLLLKNGKVFFDGKVSEGITSYLEDLNTYHESDIYFDGDKQSEAVIRSIKILNNNNALSGSVDYNEDFYVEIEFEVKEDIDESEVSVCFKNSSSVNVFLSSLSDESNNGLLSFKKGYYRSRIKVEGNFLIPDSYYVSVYIHFRNNRNIDHYEDVLKLSVIETGSVMAPYGTAATYFACVYPRTKWQVESIAGLKEAPIV